MCELLGISADQTVGPSQALSVFQKRGGETADNPDGWGLAYRLDNAWRVDKDASAAAASERFAALSKNLATDLLIAHVRKANPPSACSLTNTHPFLRECCGRPWVFAHNGKVPEVTVPEGCCHPRQSQPQGDTDSEHAFYYLLDEIARVFKEGDSLTDAPWLKRLASLSEAIAAYGQFNFLMSDGVVLIAYGHDRLHQHQCEVDGSKLILVASEPLRDDERWDAFNPGELKVFRAGECIGRLQTRPSMEDMSEVGGNIQG